MSSGEFDSVNSVLVKSERSWAAAIEILRNSGRHISERLYEQLLNFIENSNNA